MLTTTATAGGRARALLLVVAVAVSVLLLGACRAAPTDSAPVAEDGPASASASAPAAVPKPTARPSGKASTSAGLAPTRATTDLPTVTPAELPPEAVTTLTLIANGGPFPYSKDGATFGNREGELPARKSGFYREYTVKTPGSSDRGARRIVAGSDGSRFYTDDHYDSFEEVIQP